MQARARKNVSTYVYTNGELITSSTINAKLSTNATWFNTSAYHLMLGISPVSGFMEATEYVDNVRIYNRVLSSQEIADMDALDLANCGISIRNIMNYGAPEALARSAPVPPLTARIPSQASRAAVRSAPDRMCIYGTIIRRWPFLSSTADNPTSLPSSM